MIAAVEDQEAVDDLLHRTAACDLEVEVWAFQVVTEVDGSEEEELESQPSQVLQEDSHATFVEN